MAKALFGGPVRVNYFGSRMKFTAKCHRPQPAAYSIELWTNGKDKQIATTQGEQRSRPSATAALARASRRRSSSESNGVAERGKRCRRPGPEKLVAEGIRVHFEGVRAVDGVDLTLEQGQIMGLIGPNGAGKTTFMNAVSGFVPLTGGRVTLDGVDVTGLVAAAARRGGSRAHVPGRRHVSGS